LKQRFLLAIQVLRFKIGREIIPFGNPDQFRSFALRPALISSQRPEFIYAKREKESFQFCRAFNKTVLVDLIVKVSRPSLKACSHKIPGLLLKSYTYPRSYRASA